MWTVASEHEFDEKLISDRNPVGFKPSPALIAESKRETFRINSVRNALDYYDAGRYSAVIGSSPVCANLLHHAVELMMKACLAKNDTIEQILAYGHEQSYRHDLKKLRDALIVRVPALAEFNSLINDLQQWEAIRYPDSIIEKGAQMTVSLFDTPVVAPSISMPEPSYKLQLYDVDRLMGALLVTTGLNRDCFLSDMGEKRALIYKDKLRETYLGGPRAV